MTNEVVQREHLKSVCGIAVMAKASAPGRTKTRLVPPLTFDEAAYFNTAFLQDTAANLLHAGGIQPIAGFMAYGPPETEPFFRSILPPGIGLVETWFPNFGDCLLHAVTTLLERGFASAVVLNADSPTLPTALLAETAAVLAQQGDHVVLGPSSDGGYYLLGVKRPHHRLFEEIDWSSERVASQTLERAAELDLPVHLLPTWYDVDDAEALRTLHDEVILGLSSASAATPNPARHSADLIRRLVSDSDLAARLGLTGDRAPGTAGFGLCEAAGGTALPASLPHIDSGAGRPAS